MTGEKALAYISKVVITSRVVNISCQWNLRHNLVNYLWKKVAHFFLIS
jgi:hypothetical protein